MKVGSKMAKMLVCAAAAAIGLTVNAALPIVKDGKPLAAVRTVAENRQMAYAAQELTNWVFKITGAALPVNPAAGAYKTEIVLGTPDTSAAVKAFAATRASDFKRLADNDGFIIAEKGNTIYLAAGRTKGVLNAVYRFLERNSDIIWVRPMQAENGFGTIYGEMRDFKNAVADLVDVPSFGHHRNWSGGGDWGKGFIYRHQARILNCCDVWWEARDKRDSVLYADCTDLQRHVDFGMGSAYTNEWIECFPLVRGKRQTGRDHQICYGHPKTLELFTREMKKRIRESPEVKTWFKGVGDNWSLCECEWCKKDIVCPNGKVVKYEDANFRSTQYNLFLNRLVENLKKEFPDFGTIRSDGYLFNAHAPAFNTGRPVGPYCPYVKNHKKPVFDDAVNRHWHEVAEDYLKIGMPFFSLYEYYLCHTTPQFPHAVCEVAQQDYKYYHKMGLKGVYLDAGGCDNSRNCHHFDVSAIEFWTMARLMWNIDIDVTETRHEFCRRAYREAADVMIPYHDRLAKVYNSDSAGCFWNDDPVSAAKHYIVEKELAGWVRETLSRAEAAAKHPGSKELIRRHRAWMLELIDKAEKSPKRVTYSVKQMKGAPDLDPQGAYWKQIAELGPITRIHNPAPVSNTTVKVAHDRKNLYYLFEFRDAPHFLAKWKKFSDAGEIDNWPKDEQFRWDTPVEIYLDGRLAEKGGYYMFSNMFNGHKTTCHGSSSGVPLDWRVRMEPIENGLRLLATFPFESVGIDISKGNKVGSMIVGATKPGCAWNAGQWHSPTGFQTLFLEME